MNSLPRIEHKCASAERHLRYAQGDEIELLRAARILNGARIILDLTLRQRAQVIGWTPDLSESAALLADVEGHLRRVLLDSFSLTPDEVREAVERAAEQSRAALELVQEEPPPSRPPREVLP
jgi:hypothetical protein